MPGPIPDGQLRVSGIALNSLMGSQTEASPQLLMNPSGASTITANVRTRMEYKHRASEHQGSQGEPIQTVIPGWQQSTSQHSSPRSRPAQTSRFRTEVADSYGQCQPASPVIMTGTVHQLLELAEPLGLNLAVSLPEVEFTCDQGSPNFANSDVDPVL